MFIGHYGVALAAKPMRKSIPLWVLFVAVQWLDFMWSILVMLGVEKVRIVEGFTQGSDLDLYYMPYTHGLIGAAALSLLFGALVSVVVHDRRAAVVSIVAGAVFSHWLLDLVVHVPDLPLLGNSYKVGFGLWRDAWISLPLELVCLLIGAVVYDRFSPSATRSGRVGYWSFIAAMGGVEIYGAFGVAPANAMAAAETALGAYIALAGVAALVDWMRQVPAADGSRVGMMEGRPAAG